MILKIGLILNITLIPGHKLYANYAYVVRKLFKGSISRACCVIWLENGDVFPENATQLPSYALAIYQRVNANL